MRDLVFISAGLDLDGGGRAAAGRLLAASSAAYARERGIGFSVLSLGSAEPPLDGIPMRRFSGRRARQLAPPGGESESPLPAGEPSHRDAV